MVKNRKEKAFQIIRVNKGEQKNITDLVAKETFINIYVNQNFLIRLNCSPGNLKYLATGYLYSTGIIKNKEDIISINYRNRGLFFQIRNSIFCQHGIYRFYLIGKNKSILFKRKTPLTGQDNGKINIKTVFSLLSLIEDKAVYFKLTGALHNCGLANSNGTILLFCEDLSRYNTIDRILGEAFLKDIRTDDKIILTSCRITSGIIEKVIMGKIPLVISRAAPTDYAITLADRTGITLIGFARGERMNIYTHSERIINSV